jgi:hypothetical protein
VFQILGGSVDERASIRELITAGPYGRGYADQSPHYQVAGAIATIVLSRLSDGVYR